MDSPIKGRPNDPGGTFLPSDVLNLMKYPAKSAVRVKTRIIKERSSIVKNVVMFEENGTCIVDYIGA